MSKNGKEQSQKTLRVKAIWCKIWTLWILTTTSLGPLKN